jgi:hypothetical protein
LQEIGKTGEKGAERRHERSDETVACECRRAVAVFHRTRDHSMLEREEHAHTTGRWVERPDESDDEQRPEIPDRGKAKTGCCHEDRRENEPRAGGKPMRVEADEQRQNPRSEQRGSGDDADFERAESERDQVDRQQKAHVAIGERAQAPAPQYAIHGDVVHGDPSVAPA